MNIYLSLYIYIYTEMQAHTDKKEGIIVDTYDNSHYIPMDPAVPS